MVRTNAEHMEDAAPDVSIRPSHLTYRMLDAVRQVAALLAGLLGGDLVICKIGAYAASPTCEP